MDQYYSNISVMRIRLLVLIGLLCCSGCAREGLIKSSRVALGTIVEITVTDKGKPRQHISEAINEAFDEITRIERTLSKYNPESEISQINSFAHIYPVRVSAETLDIIEKSKKFSYLTNGKFDITIEPLLKLWDYAVKHKDRIPTQEKIHDALQIIGSNNIEIDWQEQSVALPDKEISLALGGIAKGYAVDRAIQTLKFNGIENALVNAGGDIYALGRRSANEKWRVALQHPRKEHETLEVLELENQAIATSGDYQRYFEVNGNRYSHIIDPETGYPCENVPASVTIIASDCLSADALATAVFVMGAEKGIELINSLDHTEAIVVTVENNTLIFLTSSGLEERKALSYE